MRQGIFIRQYIEMRRYSLEEVSELTRIPVDHLLEVLKMEVVPEDVVALIAFHIAAKMPEGFFKLPGDGQPFG